MTHEGVRKKRVVIEQKMKKNERTVDKALRQYGVLQQNLKTLQGKCAHESVRWGGNRGSCDACRKMCLRNDEGLINQ